MIMYSSISAIFVIHSIQDKTHNFRIFSTLEQTWNSLNLSKIRVIVFLLYLPLKKKQNKNKTTYLFHTCYFVSFLIKKTANLLVAKFKFSEDTKVNFLS